MKKAFEQVGIEHPPKGWTVERFDALFDVQQGKQVSKKNRDGANPHPFLRTKNVFWGRLDLEELDEMHFTGAEEIRLKLKPNDLLICEGGSIGRTAVWKGQHGRCYYQNHLHRARLKKQGSADAEFVLYWFWYAFELGSVYFGRGNTTTIPNLSQSKLCELPLPVPPPAEQRKIATVLDAVQRAIAQQERILELTEELKKTLMHRFFTKGLHGGKARKTEIGQVPAGWDVVRLGEKGIAESFDYGTSVKCGYETPGVPVLRIPNVAIGCVDSSDIKFGQPKRNEIGELQLRCGDLLFVRTNGVLENAGRCALFRGELADCYFASYLIRVRVNEKKLNPAFLALYAQTERGIGYLSGKAIRTADGKFNINSGTLKAVMLPLPSIEEQHEIVKQLDCVEKKLGIHRRKHVALTELFRTLLHRLMTGQMRVNQQEPL